MSNAALRKVKCTEPTEDAVEILTQDGALIISELLSNQEYADLRTYFPHFESTISQELSIEVFS